MSQYLYLIKCQQFYKIGIANDVESRLAQLSTGNPYPLIVQVIYEFDNAEVVERSLHQCFKDKRQRGEWFELSYDDTVKIHRICLDLGASAREYTARYADESELEEAEEMQELPEGAKFDYAAMFADGWFIEKGNPRKGDWRWRKNKHTSSEKYIYGGLIKDLPYPDLETMRRVYRDGLEPLAESEQK